MIEWVYIKATSYKINRDGVILKPGGGRVNEFDRGNGYPSFCIKEGKKWKIHNTHRVLAESFIPNPENKATVNHKDGDRANNALENLEWATVQENVLHGFRSNGRIPTPGLSGSKSPRTKLTEAIVLEIREKYATGDYPYSKLMKIYKVTAGCLSHIINRGTWKHI